MSEWEPATIPWRVGYVYRKGERRWMLLSESNGMFHLLGKRLFGLPGWSLNPTWEQHWGGQSMDDFEQRPMNDEDKAIAVKEMLRHAAGRSD